jgi:hypothetical protein
VLAFIDPVLGMKSNVFHETSTRLGGSFSVKTLRQGSFNFLFQNENEGVGLVRSKTVSRGLETLHGAFISG